MRILLDTHIFIWWDSTPDQLSAEARRLCEDADNTLVLSIASVWEMQIKYQLGKLSLHKPLPDLIRSQQQTNGLELLPVQLEHVYALSSLPPHHKDPFDRLLIAQARTEGLALVSMDAAFQQYPVTLLG
ncbi:MAG TPA: type II toxin-antitoxin system VapC family toxin [Chthonomonadaceae bacterium]|nr:type II toxin-antitoxin system VapC family toxin [Chthonomonadaceae bacterium]